MSPSNEMMSETISLPKIKPYVLWLAPLGLLLTVLLLLAYTMFYVSGYSDNIGSRCLLYGLLISGLCTISMNMAVAHHDYLSRIFPRTISFQENAIFLVHSDILLAKQRGYQDKYPLSECIWYQGYTYYANLYRFGISFTPVNTSKVIVIYHKPTSMKIECGFTSETYEQWRCLLQNYDIPKWRNRSPSEPGVVCTAFILGVYLSFTYFLPIACIYGGIGGKIIFMFPPIFLAVLGSSLCGNEIFCDKRWKLAIGVLLALIFSGCCAYSLFII